MAFLIVQHLEPSHESLLVDLLSARTRMRVVQATDGMEIERERVHIIPPGAYLSVDGKGVLRLSRAARATRGAASLRLPAELAGQDLRPPRRLRGHVGHRRRRQLGIEGGEGEGRPRSRPRRPRGGLRRHAAQRHRHRRSGPHSPGGENCRHPRRARARASAAPVGATSPRPVPEMLPDIVDLLRKKTVHDFTLYKRGTLERHVERRMAMAGVKTAESYFARLRRDEAELDQLSREMLINVTGFFRDPSVFDYLAREDHSDSRARSSRRTGRCEFGSPVAVPARRPIRWPCCSASRSTNPSASIKLQIFASDVDADAVARAREGLYPPSIEAEVSPERLRQFFTRGRSRLPDLARAARERRFHGARRPGRPALRKARLRFLPQSADLSAARGAG